MSRRNYAAQFLSYSASEFPRHYGPSPSDSRPSPSSTLPPPSNIQPQPSPKRARRRKYHWTDVSRERLKEAYLVQKSQGNVHRLDKWRQRNPAAAHALFSEAATLVRKREAETKLMTLLTSFLPRTLNIWKKIENPRYRLTLFGTSFSLQNLERDDRRFDWGQPRSVSVSLSLSFDAPHPYRARRIPGSPLDAVGIRVFGRNPLTNDPFHEWITTGDTVLRRILEVADRVEDQTMLRKVCSIGLERNLAGERWGN